MAALRLVFPPSPLPLAAPALVRIAAKVSPEQLAELFKHPTAKMTAGGMPPVDLRPDDLKALIVYVESLK